MTRLVFLDETAITTNMVRVRGRCPRSERLVSYVPQREWKTITLRHNRDDGADGYCWCHGWGSILGLYRAMPGPNPQAR
jgi:hypothetical protein